jgi:dTDP-4-amino-4,6-dideoxygalactose transaminase
MPSKWIIQLFDTSLGEDEAKAASEVIRSGWLSQGSKVTEFESKFAEYVGTRFAVAVSSCTAALHLCLAECGISQGDEVITTPLTFVATANSILYQRARPVFADVSYKTLNIDPIK